MMMLLPAVAEEHGDDNDKIDLKFTVVRLENRHYPERPGFDINASAWLAEHIINAGPEKKQAPDMIEITWSTMSLLSPDMVLLRPGEIVKEASL